MTMLAFATYCLFGLVIGGLTCRYLWDPSGRRPTCPTGVSRSICLIKRALDAMGAMAAGVVKLLALGLALASLWALWHGAVWPLATLCILGLLTGASVTVQIRERGALSPEPGPWKLSLALTLLLPVVSVAPLL